MIIGAGESILIPASLGSYRLSGNLSALKAYVPDLKNDIVQPLIRSGKRIEEIRTEIGGLSRILS